MSIDERRKHLFLVADHALKVHQEWAEGDLPHVTEELERVCDELIEIAASGDVPASCRNLVDAIAGMGAEWEAWKADAAMDAESHPVPGQGFWVRFEKMVAARRAAQPRPAVKLESIAELTAQKVPDAQICVIYGFLDEDRAPQLGKLREEREKPGTHVGPDFVGPHELARRRELAREAAVVRRIKSSQEELLRRAAARPAEEIPDLVEQGLSLRQIAGMHKMQPEAVAAECEALGIAPPQLDYTPLQAQRGEMERQLSDEEQRAMAAEELNPVRGTALDGPSVDLQGDGVELQPMQIDDYGAQQNPPPAEGPLTLEQQIVKLAEAGKRPGEIAAVMSGQGVSQQKAAAVMRRWQEEPEAFEPAGVAN